MMPKPCKTLFQAYFKRAHVTLLEVRFRLERGVAFRRHRSAAFPACGFAESMTRRPCPDRPRPNRKSARPQSAPRTRRRAGPCPCPRSTAPSHPAVRIVHPAHWQLPYPASAPLRQPQPAFLPKLRAIGKTAPDPNTGAQLRHLPSAGTCCRFASPRRGSGETDSIGRSC